MPISTSIEWSPWVHIDIFHPKAAQPIPWMLSQSAGSLIPDKTYLHLGSLKTWLIQMSQANQVSSVVTGTLHNGVLFSSLVFCTFRIQHNTHPTNMLSQFEQCYPSCCFESKPAGFKLNLWTYPLHPSTSPQPRSKAFIYINVWST